jgi:hypothetical protein
MGAGVSGSFSPKRPPPRYFYTLSFGVLIHTGLSSHLVLQLSK